MSSVATFAGTGIARDPLERPRSGIATIRSKEGAPAPSWQENAVFGQRGWNRKNQADKGAESQATGERHGIDAFPASNLPAPL